MARRRKSKHVSDRDFVKVNIEMKNCHIADIAKRLGLQPTTVAQRRVKINKISRILPALQRGQPKKSVDFTALAAEVTTELEIERFDNISTSTT